jgi:CheY-like chemotaxis protein
VEGDPAQLTQVILNLVTNAGDACSNGAGSRVGIRLDRRPGREGVSGAVHLRVEDDGVGMNAEVRSRIFDPFYTTKLTGRGLGLSSTLGIVRAHGGSISVRSAPGRGSAFSLVLPALVLNEQEPAATLPPPSGEPPQGAAASPARGSRILVVDDEAPVRRLAVSALTRAGHDAEGVESGEVALARIAAGRLPDLILLDIAMPGMSGIEVLGELRSEHPHLPVLLSSGYAGREASGVADPAVDFLPKPYRLSQLTAAVEALLERVGARATAVG